MNRRKKTSRRRWTPLAAFGALDAYDDLLGGFDIEDELSELEDLLGDQRSRPEDLAHLRVRASSGELVPLSALVTTEERPALQAITRQDRERGSRGDRNDVSALRADPEMAGICADRGVSASPTAGSRGSLADRG